MTERKDSMSKLQITVVAVAALVSFGLGIGRAEASAQEGVKAEPSLSRKSAVGKEFFVAGMSCAGCANSATELLEKIPGVHEAKVDFDSKKASIQAGRVITRDEVREALGKLGFEARFPGDLVIRPLSEEEKANLDIETASHGEAIKLKDHLAPGNITIFDYYADWCGPCHLFTPKLERLLLKYKNLALRKVDISDWESKAAKQAAKEFGLPGLPYVRIYGPKGKLLGAVHGNHIKKVEAIIKRSLEL